MNPVEFLNAWGASWFGFMARALIDASVLLAVILVVWLPMRRRVSAQLAHGLFCLVLLKLIVPVPVGWSWWQRRRSALDRLLRHRTAVVVRASSRCAGRPADDG